MGLFRAASHPAAELAARRPVRAASPPAGASHGGNMKRAGSRAHPGEYLGRLGGYPAYTSSAHAVGSLGSVLSGGAQMSPKQQLRLCSRLSVPKVGPARCCFRGRGTRASREGGGTRWGSLYLALILGGARVELYNSELYSGALCEFGVTKLSPQAFVCLVRGSVAWYH